MRIARNWFLLISIAAFSAQVEAEQLKVGDERATGSHLKPFQVRWVARDLDEQSGATKVRFQIDESVERVNVAGRDLIRFTQSWNDADGNNIFTTVRTADASTLEYAAFHTGASPSGFSHLDFDGRYVQGFHAAEAHERATEIAAFLEEPVFASLGGLLYALVLRDFDDQVVIPGFGFGGENPIYKLETLAIQGATPITIAQGEERTARTVTSTRSPGTTYWVDSEKPPYFLKARVQKADGKTTVYEIESYETQQ